MRYSADKLSGIDLGRQGENLARTIEIDVSSLLAQWPDAAISLLVKRKHDADPYVANTEVRDGVLYWPITAADTASAGDGKVELRAVCGEVLAKSATGSTRVTASLTGNETDPPEAAQGWVDQVLEAGAGIRDSARQAEDAAERAEQAADMLSGIRARAVTTAPGTEATVEVVDGVITYSIPRGDTGLQGAQGEQGVPGAQGEQGAQGIPGKDAVVDATLTQSGQAADAKTTGEALSGKLNEPSEGLAVGRYFRIARIDDTGHAVLETVNLPIAANDRAGVVQVSAYDGWYMYGNRLQARTIESANFAGTNNTAIIGKGTLNSILSTPSVMPSLSADEQAAARERLGQEAINCERERRLVNLEYAARGYLYREETDAELAYEKTVPNDVTPWITLDQIGGRTLVWNQGVRETANTSGVRGNVVNNSTIYYAPSSEEYSTPMVAGHIYFCCARVEIDTDYTLKESDQYGAFGVGFGDRYYTTDVTQHIPCASDHVGTLIFKATASQTERYDSPKVFMRLWTLLDTTAEAGTYINVSMTHQMIIDLTVMFGAGNEPSTVAEFRAMFPEEYYPYAEPNLTTFTCNEVRIQGRNLYSGKESFGWVEGRVYAYARLPTNDTYSLQVKIKDGMTIPAQVFFGFGTGDYNTGAVTWLVKAGLIGKDNAVSLTSQHYLVCHPKTFYASMEDYLEISLVRGSTPELLPYQMERMDMSALTARYFPDGMRSTGLVHDALDLERGVAIQRVDQYVFDGSEKWTLAAEHDACNRFYASALQNGNGNAAAANVICNKLETNADASVDKVGCCLTGNAPSRLFSIFLPKTEYPDAESVQQYIKGMADAGDPLIAYYGLYTPVETPITEELTTDIEVEPGGTLTFVNDQGDAYRVPVPNQETWLVKVGGAG